MRITRGRARERKGPYHQVYLSHVEHAISSCRTVRPLQHPGEKGRIREILLRSLFRPLLPSDLGIGTGFVLGAAGAVSSQQDIVLYDRSTLPPALFDSDLGFFPIESVLHVIEVKSVLNRHELSTSHEAAKSLSSFMIHDKGGNMVSTGPRPTTSIIALDTDLTPDGRGEVARYDEVRGQDPPFLSALCIVGSGYWWFDDGAFRAWPERYESSEVMGFLGGILNALPNLYEIRRSTRPPLGAYLIDFGADFTEVLFAIGRVGGELTHSWHPAERLVTLSGSFARASTRYRKSSTTSSPGTKTRSLPMPIRRPAISSKV